MACQPPITDQLMTLGCILWHINSTNLDLTGPLVRAGKVHVQCVCVCRYPPAPVELITMETQFAAVKVYVTKMSVLLTTHSFVCFLIKFLISEHLSFDNYTSVIFLTSVTRFFRWAGSLPLTVLYQLHQLLYVQSITLVSISLCLSLLSVCVCVSHSLSNCLITLLHQQLSLEH